MTKRIAVLASGRGSNFQAVIDAIASGKIPATCVALITDNPKAYAIERAGTAGIPVKVVDYRSFPAREAYERALLAVMQECRADLFVLAGYMRIVGPEIVRAFPGKMVNIHPALLPSFQGLHAQRQAWLYGVKVSGCTVHFVDESLDGGPIILQRIVPVLDDDDEDSLAERILDQEHIAFSEAIRLFCEDKLEIVGRKVRIRK
ncbi:phosphoribosylglycinamide formyltransferase [Methanoregula sp.]|uniref:phosphoribosylglycinamide formyltransferase n=1 Tax=Methanoregula sp. TaxID=2052170 RepID=UPI000CB13B07|nr:phosphoribosylglycinamide formyltransferase [Methanoregula sp.]PKG33963.1 MAG: phosphoribosylglycinamide formyltransferase [Methanoregula sp.]